MQTNFTNKLGPVSLDIIYELYHAQKLMQAQLSRVVKYFAVDVYYYL